MEKPNNNFDNNANSSPSMQNFQNKGNQAKKGQTFVDKRTSLQGLMGRHHQQNQIPPNETQNQKKSKQSSVGPTVGGGANSKHGATHSGVSHNNLEIQQKRNSYSFNSKEQQKISPQNDLQFKNNNKQGGGHGPAASSTSPVQDGANFAYKKRGQPDDANGPGAASLGQKLMSYFNNNK